MRWIRKALLEPMLGGLLARGEREAQPTRTLGQSGARVFGGFIQTREKNRALTGQERFKTFSEIVANTTIVAAGVRYFLNLLAKAEWSVEPNEEGGSRAEEIAERIQADMDGLHTPWHRVVRRAGMYVFYGFSIQEWTARRLADGGIGMFDIAPRPQVTIRRWILEDDGRVRAVVQEAPQTQDEIVIPREKLVYLVDDSLNDQPDGLGLLRHVADAARRLQLFERLEGVGFETDLQGIPVARVPYMKLAEMLESQEIDKTTKDALEDAMEDFIQNHNRGPATGVILDSATYETDDEARRPSNVPMFDLDVIRGSGVGPHGPIGDAIRRLNREVAEVLGVDQLMLGSDGTGSLALSRDKTEAFFLRIDGSLNEIRETMEKDYIARLAQLNGWDESLVPELKVEPLRFRDVEQISSTLRDLAVAGMPLGPGDVEVYNTILDTLGLPRIEREDMSELLDASLMGGSPIETPTQADEEEMPDDEVSSDL